VIESPEAKWAKKKLKVLGVGSKEQGLWLKIGFTKAKSS
jgi:hypothetical protein